MFLFSIIVAFGRNREHLQNFITVYSRL
uniref:Uncharacterized protein n=1 Tax=Ciona intestinalis TaxID=7719 RepID=H2Y2S9_CIOIN